MLKSIRNTIANFIGGLTALALMLVFNALYFRIAPDEVFSVISLLLTAQLLVPALDFGTGRTAGRILAADLALARDAPAGRSFLRDHRYVHVERPQPSSAIMSHPTLGTV